MVTIYCEPPKKNKAAKKVLVLVGKHEAMLRMICEENQSLFSKINNDSDIGKITYKSLSATEAKIDIGYVYLWKDYIIEFDVS